MRKSSRPASGSSRLGRLAKFFLTIYLLLAILYTAWHFVLSPALHLVIGTTPPTTAADLDPLQAVGGKGQLNLVATSTKLKHAALETAAVKAADIREEDAQDPVWQAAEAAEKRGKKNKAKEVPYVRPDNLSDGRELAHKRMHGLEGVEWDLDEMSWHHPTSDFAHSGPPSAPAPYEDGPRTPTAISEDHFLSLSFSSALQPSKVIPYYYRASDPDRVDFNKEDITITTLVTSNRFEVFLRLVERYQGMFGVPCYLSIIPEAECELHRPRLGHGARQRHQRPLGAPSVARQALQRVTLHEEVRRHPPRVRPLRPPVQYVAQHCQVLRPYRGELLVVCAVAATAAS